jgi:hypothetical protein
METDFEEALREYWEKYITLDNPLIRIAVKRNEGVEEFLEKRAATGRPVRRIYAKWIQSLPIPPQETREEYRKQQEEIEWMRGYLEGLSRRIAAEVFQERFGE